MRTILVLVVGLFIGWLVFAGGLRTLTNLVNPVSPQPPAAAQTNTQDPSPSPTNTAVPQPPPTATTAPAPPVQTSSGPWTCPGEAVANNGCLVKTTTDLMSGLCVDFDPTASSVAGPKEDRGSKGPQWSRVLMTGQGAWSPNGSGPTATIYPDPSCPRLTG